MSHTATIMREGRDIEIEVDYQVTSWGAPASWSSYGGDPPEPVEVELGEAVLVDDGTAIELTPEEDERINLAICEVLEREGPPDDYD